MHRDTEESNLLSADALSLWLYPADSQARSRGHQFSFDLHKGLPPFTGCTQRKLPFELRRTPGSVQSGDNDS